MSERCRGAVLSIAMLVAAGCGSGARDSAGPDAGGVVIPQCAKEFTPCGGDPRGRWKVVSFCGNRVSTIDIAETAHCKGMPTTVEIVGAQGTYNYRDDGTVHVELEMVTNATLGIAPECVPELVEGEWPAAQVCDAFARELRRAAESATCAVTHDQGCDCSLLGASSSDFFDAPWRLEGDTLLEDESEQPACVDGEVMVRHQEGADGWLTGVLARE